MNTLSVKPTSATTGSTSTLGLLSNSPAEKNKQWQRELLMERIRTHASQHKTFPELSKSMRMSMLEKRYALDAVEKSNLQKCLDSMQHCIKVTSRQGLVERLESLSRQLGLKFMEDPAGLFISTDMFFLEIILDANGALTDVKVHHECKIEQQSCSELVNCLNRGDFADFTVQLEGLSSIYQLNAEPKVKTKAFVALQAMETDLYNIFQMQNFTKDKQQLLEESTVGIVLKRRGGHPMKLTYFVAPYDLISIEGKCLQQLSLELLSSKDIGMSVTVNLEAASANKLQIQPTVTFAKDTTQSTPASGVAGVDLPIYAPLTQVNSTLLPATFVLRLNKPLPVCSATLRILLPVTAATTVAATIGENVTTGIEQKLTTASSSSTVNSTSNVSTIMNLIVQTASEQQLKNSSKGLFVCLPDQTHCYFFTDNKQLKATLVSSVPFTEPAQVPKILAFLKKQALFYTLLASCVRPQTKMGNDMDSTTILEVNAISFQQISVSLQHPYEESMATVEFNLNDSAVNCTIYSISRNYDLLSLKLTKIAQKSLSIPVTLRALLKFWDQERMKMFQRGIGVGSTGSTASGGGGGIGNSGSTQGASAFGNFSLAMAPNDPGGRMSTGNSSIGNNSSGTAKIELSSANSQRQFVPTNIGVGPNSASGIAGYLKFKSDIKQEDFHESPKSQIQSIVQQSVEAASSLGQTTNQQLQQQPQQQTTDVPIPVTATGVSTEIEIADKYKNIWKDKTPNLKNTVSITPIMNTIVTSSSSSTLDSATTVPSAQTLEIKRTGIEIIPLISQQNASGSGCITSNMSQGSSTITITPINSGISNVLKSDKKSTLSATTSSSSSNPATSLSSTKRNIDINSSAIAPADAQKEKKRKKKRDDSPMGPPEKIFSRQNSPATIASAGVEAVARKFSSPSSSPKGSSGGMLATAAGSSLSARPSPKHSPVYSSPKHSTASNSPKSPFGTHSPKHGSSGKPSMSTLKSAAANLSPKSDKTNLLTAVGVGGAVNNSLATSTLGRSMSTGSAGGAITVGGGSVTAGGGVNTTLNTKNRDKERSNLAINILSTTATSVKTNLAAVSLQQLKSSTNLNHLTVAGNLGAANNTGGGGLAVPSPSLDLMRKGVSGAVSLMTSTTISTAAAATIPTQHGIDTTASQSPTTNTVTTPSEYMVKQSQEGLKLTINKTCNKSSSSFSTNKTKSASTSNLTFLNCSQQQTSSTLIKKIPQHTGLKPGVNSGPASKKPPAYATSCSGSGYGNTLTITTSSGNQSRQPAKKHIFQKSNSSGNLNFKLSPSKNASLSGSNTVNKTNDRGVNVEYEHSLSSSSQPATRLDHHADMMKILQYASPAMAANMEGFMKNLNNKFQIPKLSQRSVNAEGTKPTSTTTGAISTKLTKIAAPTTIIANTATITKSQTTVAAVSETTKSEHSSLKMPLHPHQHEQQQRSFQQHQQRVFSDSNSLSTKPIISIQQQQPQFFNNIQHINEKKELQQYLMNSTTTIRPPPPPYHTAIEAASNSKVPAITTLNSQQHKPTLSVHILKPNDKLEKNISTNKDNSTALFPATNAASSSTTTGLVGK